MMQAVTLKQYKTLFRQLNAFSQSKGLVFLKQIGVVEAREFRNTWTVAPRTAGRRTNRQDFEGVRSVRRLEPRAPDYLDKVHAGIRATHR